MTLLDLLVDRKRQSGRTSNKIRAVFDVTQRVWAEYVMMMCNEFVDEWLAMSSSTSRGAREWWGWSNVQRIAPFALDYSKWIDKSPANSAFTRRSSSGDEIFQLTSPLISSHLVFYLCLWPHIYLPEMRMDLLLHPIFCARKIAARGGGRRQRMF